MNLNQLKGLKYYFIYVFVLFSFFVYSGIIGWKWFNTTETHHTRSTYRTGHYLRYHK
jgi:hypothetical protein